MCGTGGGVAGGAGAKCRGGRGGTGAGRRHRHGDPGPAADPRSLGPQGPGEQRGRRITHGVMNDRWDAASGSPARAPGAASPACDHLVNCVVKPPTPRRRPRSRRLPPIRRLRRPPARQKCRALTLPPSRPNAGGAAARGRGRHSGGPGQRAAVTEALTEASPRRKNDYVPHLNPTTSNIARVVVHRAFPARQPMPCREDASRRGA